MNFLNSCKSLIINIRSYATKNYLPAKPYRSIYDRSAHPRTKLDAKTIEILENASLVGKITEENIKIVEDAIAFGDLILQVDTKNVEPVYTVLEDWPLNLREDKVQQEVCFFDLTKNAKRFEEDYFVAPPVNVPINQAKDSDD